MNSPRNELVSVPPDLLARLRSASGEEQRSAEELVQEALERYLDDLAWKRIYAYGDESARALGVSEDAVGRAIAEYRAERRSETGEA